MVRAWYHNSTPSSRGLVPPKQLKSPHGIRRRWAKGASMWVVEGDLTMTRIDALDMRLGAHKRPMCVLLPAIHAHHFQGSICPKNLGSRSTVMDLATIRPSSLTKHVSHGTNPIIVSTNCPMQFINVTTCTRGGGIGAPFSRFCGQFPSHTVSLAMKLNLNCCSSCCSFNVFGSLDCAVEVVGDLCLSAMLDSPGPPVVIRPPTLNFNCSRVFFFFSGSCGSCLTVVSPSTTPSISSPVKSIISLDVELDVK
jgi:hypothetical protein